MQMIWFKVNLTSSMHGVHVGFKLVVQWLLNVWVSSGYSKGDKKERDEQRQETV